MFNSYERYGNPHKLVEFRMMVLNHCSMDCKGCFYRKELNDYSDFDFSLDLCRSLIENDYKMETCYLLPTDIFDNKDNYKLFDNPTFQSMIKNFSYVGIASTLETGFDDDFYQLVKKVSNTLKIELQINLLFNKLFDVNYLLFLKTHIKYIKSKYGEDVVINLAINTGFKISDVEKDKLKSLLSQLSDDEIVELNFTFLFNPDISDEKKQNMMVESVRIVNEFGEYYEENEHFTTKYNNRTLLRKPAFTFLGYPNRVYLTPIIPFDEYVLIEDDKYLMNEPSYDGFLDTYGRIEDINTLILNKCESCENLTHCLGKGYFSISKRFNLGCFMDIK